MRRDYELVRSVMLELEAIPPGQAVNGSVLSRADRDDATLAEHLVLLIQEQMLEGKAYTTFDGLGPDQIIIIRVTWKGHEFLDAVREERVWNIVKTKLANVGGRATFEIITQLGSAALKGFLGLT